MTSWRDTASRQAQGDLDRLFNVALDHAEELLRDGARLVPFAAAVAQNGAADVVHDLAEATGSARSDLARLYDAARSRSAQFRAVAFTAVITLDGSSAVRIQAEHRDGIALALRVPYRQRFLGGVRFGTMRLADGPVRVWR